MSNKEWRGLKPPIKVERLQGGVGTVTEMRRKDVVIKFGHGRKSSVIERSYEHLYLHYKPIS